MNILAKEVGSDQNSRKHITARRKPLPNTLLQMVVCYQSKIESRKYHLLNKTSSSSAVQDIGKSLAFRIKPGNSPRNGKIRDKDLYKSADILLLSEIFFLFFFFVFFRPIYRYISLPIFYHCVDE